MFLNSLGSSLGWIASCLSKRKSLNNFSSFLVNNEANFEAQAPSSQTYCNHATSFPRIQVFIYLFLRSLAMD